MKLILIRHGRTEANERHLYCGSTDLPLSEGGREELRRKRETVRYPALDGVPIVTSGMRRCEETLELLYGARPHEVDPAFREMDFGAFEMRSYEEMKNDPRYLAWITGENEANVTPGGESGEQMRARVFAALETRLRKGEDIALVTHGGVIAAVMERLFPEEGKNRYEWQPGPGGGYVVEVEEKRYREIK